MYLVERSDKLKPQCLSKGNVYDCIYIILSPDPARKGLVTRYSKNDKFVGHQSDSRKVKLKHYLNLRHNNGIQLNELGNL